jgi:hypothetical protein
MATTITPSLVQQLRLETQREFGESGQPKWKVRERLVNEVRGAVENRAPCRRAGPLASADRSAASQGRLTEP